jgi:hypothetical protein
MLKNESADFLMKVCSVILEIVRPELWKYFLYWLNLANDRRFKIPIPGLMGKEFID